MDKWEQLEEELDKVSGGADIPEEIMNNREKLDNLIAKQTVEYDDGMKKWELAKEEAQINKAGVPDSSIDNTVQSAKNAFIPVILCRYFR